MTHQYWIKFSKDPVPGLYTIENWKEFLDRIFQYLPTRGYIEWMIRE